MKRYFIIGTDTDCGKTYVTCQLLDYFKKRGHRSFGIKPVASGCLEQNNRLISEDVVQLQQHNGASQHDICPWRFKPAISPHLAAEELGERLSAAAISNFCNDETFRDLDYLLIEGAGGLMVPLNNTETWVDFLNLSRIPVILVVGMRLGCINHALLTAFALKIHEISCVGWIANCIDEHMLALPGNITSLKEKMGLPLLATIPYGGHIDNSAGIIQLLG